MSSNPLDHVRSMIVVLAMPGCPACDEYTPRFEKYVEHFQKHGAPFTYYEPGQAITKRTIPIMIIDATSADPNVQAFCDLHKIEGLPTTILLTHNAAPQRLEGSQEDGKIYEVLTSAVYAAR